MTPIDQFIATAAGSLGETDSSTRAATAGLLGALKDNAEPEDFRRMLDAIPGAAPLLHTEAAHTAEEGDEGISGAIGWVRAALGGTSGEIGFLQAVEDAGFSSQKIGHFVILFRSFAEGHAGQAQVKKVFSEAPDLALLAREHVAQE